MGESEERQGGTQAKRLLLLLLVLIICASYVALTTSRYTGQGLNPTYLRVTTLSDSLSLLTTLLLLLPVVLSLLNPGRISLSRTILATVVSALLLWMEIGVNHFDASDFSTLASVGLLCGIFLQVGLISTISGATSNWATRSWRVLRNALAVFGAFLVFGFVYSFAYPAVTDVAEITRYNADAGVVFGAAVWSGNNLGTRPSPALRGRIDVGYDLLKSKAISRLVVTGASAPGEEAESQVALKEFVKRGIDPASIIAEQKTHSTIDQVRYIRDELKAKQGWTRFVVISDQYHLARILEMCRFHGLHAIGTPSKIRQPILDLAYYRLRESLALLAYWLLGK